MDRRKATKARRTAKEVAFYEMKEDKLAWTPNATLEFVFFPKDDHRFDLDNALAAMKPSIDAMALASKCDDDRWSYYVRKGTKNGVGEVRIREIYGQPLVVLGGVG